MDSPPNMLEVALSYAARGWRVVPLHEVLDSRDGLRCSCNKEGCESQGKHPRLNQWQKAATSDERTIRNWWAVWPAANVGVALGTLSGIVSVDVDTVEGEEQLRELAGGEPEPTLEYRTGKGRRLLYAIPECLECDPKTTVRKGKDGSEAVRFQGTGGQCVMPPSRHSSGKRYEWVRSEGEPTPLPGWLFEQMCRDDEPEPTANPKWADQGARDAFAEGRDFNRDSDWWADILSPAGFRQAGSVGGVDRYTRPGKKEGVSVTVGHYRAADGTPAMYVFSGSIPGLDAEKCYDKFGAFCRLHCGGDFERAAERIVGMGFGKRKSSKATSCSASDRVASDPKDDDFGDPIPLDDPSPKLLRFPTHVFPQALQDLVLGASESVSCPVDYAASHALAVAAGAIGAAYDMKVKRGFVVPSILWVCVVAPPGSGKSPSAQPVLAPVYTEQSRRRQTGNDKPIYVEDVTTEKLARLLNDDPRGLTMIWDEMAGWLTSFNQYKAGGRGGDRSRYLSIWDGRPVKVDRQDKDKTGVFVQRPRLSVVGGIQPEVLDQLRVGPSDGLFDRLLFSYPIDSGLSVESFAELDEEPCEAWAKAVSCLRAYDMKPADDEGLERPKLIDLNESGRPIWADWTKTLHDRAASPDAPEYFRALAAKMQGYAGRLALVVHLLREVYGDRPGTGIGEDDMMRGVALADYFLSHADRVRRAAGRDARLIQARAILRWLETTKKDRFTRSDAWESLRNNAAFSKPADLDEPFRLLTLHRCVRWLPAVQSNKPGRPTLGSYQRNPRLVAGYDQTI